MLSLLRKTSLFVFLLLYACAGGTDDLAFQIVVNAANPVDSVDAKFLADIYLKKKTVWPDSHAVLAVDLEAGSKVRGHFSEKILERPVSAVRNYWQQLLFSGRGVPPPEFKTEEEVLRFVGANPDAIGYISIQTDPRTLKVLRIE